MIRKDETMNKIILASGSPRRREIMQQVGIEFDIETSEEEELYHSTEPEEIVKELALMKAQAVAGHHEKRGITVIGADTVVVYDGKILGKPKDEDDAYRMIEMLQGEYHQVYTGVAILDYDTGGKEQIISHAEETKVYVVSMEPEEIRTYIATKEPMDKAGAYGIQGYFAAYIGRIEGDYYNVVGLPIAYVSGELKKIRERSKSPQTAN